VTVALELAVMAAVVTLNVPEAAEAEIVTDVGTVSAVLLFDRAMLAPPAGAACDRLTVQVLDAFGPRLAGLQVSEEISTAVPRLTVVVAELPLYVAVMVALELAPTAAVVTVNVAEVAAAATATEGGTVSVALVFERVMLMPPLGAACVTVTVQVLEEFAPRVAGVQDSKETDSGPTRVITLVAAVSR
jgi:hypothetical protein